MKVIGRTEIQINQRIFVCEKHFEQKDISVTHSNSRRNIKKGVVPTLLLPPPRLGSLIRTKPRRVYKRTITTDQKVNRTNTKSINEEKSTRNKMAVNEIDANDELIHPSSPCNTITNKALDSFTKLYLKFKDNTESSKIYSDQYKLKILQLYYGNSQAYEILQSTLGLPPISTLPSFIPSTPDGINETCLNSLKAKIGLMSLNQKYGTLCVRIMKIKPYVHYDYKLDSVTGICAGSNVCAPAQYSLVAMVRGMTTDWHEIVSIYLLVTLDMLKEFNTWIDKLIKKLTEIGINIKAVVTSTHDFFINAFALRDMHEMKPFFNVNDKKVYHVYDPLHSMLLLCHELKNDMVIYQRAKWDHISKFYEQDSTRRFPLAHGLPCTINKNDLEQNKLKAAAQILSLNTAAGMSTFIDLGILDKNAMATAEFIVRINKIFTLLYPNAFQPEHKHMLTQAQADHLWHKNISFLRCVNTRYSNTHGSEVKSKVNFIKCFITSMKSVLLIQAESSLKEHATVLTQYLNQDPLVQFIDKINFKTVNNKYPTINEFFNIFKDNLIVNNFQKIESKENITRMDNFIENANKIIELQNCFEEPVNKTLHKRSFEDYREDYSQLECDDANSIYYVATYLLDKMYQKYKNLVSTRIKFMNSSVYYENREDGLSGSIIIPDNDFLQFVLNMDVVFFNHCKKAMASAKLFEELMKQMGNLTVTVSMEKGPLEYILGLFVDMRIYHTIKYNNDLYERGNSDAQPFQVRRLFD